MAKPHQEFEADLDLRIVIDGAVAMSPLQASLLEAIRDAGSISAARRRLGMSYAHVWKLVAAMNERFLPALISISRGGAGGGGASLTTQGHMVLRAFRKLETIVLNEGRSERLAISRAARQTNDAEAGASIS